MSAVPISSPQHSFGRSSIACATIPSKIACRILTGRGYPFDSALQLHAVYELVERLRVGERLAVLHRPAVHDVAHGQLHYLPTLRPWNVADLDDARRGVPRGRIPADLAADVLDEPLIEREAVPQADEEDDALVAVPLLSDHQALD